VKGRKIEEHNTVRKNPLEGKIVTSHIYTHKNLKIKMQESILLTTGVRKYKKNVYYYLHIYTHTKT